MSSSTVVIWFQIVSVISLSTSYVKPVTHFHTIFYSVRFLLSFFLYYSPLVVVRKIY